MSPTPDRADAVWRWWLRRVPGTDRLVLLAAVIVRLGGVLMLCYVLPMVWAQLRHPLWSVLLAAGLAIESVAVMWWWIRHRRLAPVTLWIDLPTIAAALGLGSALSGGSVDWTLFAYPYAILISLGFGLTCRTLIGAVGSGAWSAGAGVAGLLLASSAGPQTVMLIAPTYLVNPVVGWGCARLLRRATDELEAARIDAMRQTADLEVAAERARMSTALHDRVLQTLETLGRAGSLDDESLRERVAGQAAWLRRYVETGRPDQTEDVTVGLSAAARAAAHAGLTVELNDARLRVLDSGGHLASEQREALIEAVHQTISAFGPTGGELVVRAVPEAGGVLVTVLSTGRASPDPEVVADATARLSAAGGRLTVEPVPYAELWVPGPDGHRPSGDREAVG